MIRCFFVTFPDDDDIEEIVELIRPLKLGNVVPTMIRATNDLYLAGAHQKSPEYGATRGKVSQDNAAGAANSARRGRLDRLRRALR